MIKKNILIFFLIIFLTFTCGNPIKANFSVSVGTKISDISESTLKSDGFKIVDNTGALTYTWPYTLNWITDDNSAYGGSVLSNAGQVSASITFDFTGNYVAVAFCETYYAAKINIAIDGKVAGEYTPFLNDKVLSEKPGDSKIIFVKDNLTQGNHTITISHEAAHTSGEDNIKADGTAYYDNDAYFDCIIVKNESTTIVPQAIELGADISFYNDDIFDNLGYKPVYSSNEEIIYTWPYDLDNAKIVNAGREYRSNLGQVSAELSYDFEGSYIAVVLAECYYAATVNIDIDGEAIGSVTPHTDLIKVSDTPYKSKIFFIKDNLKSGSHTITLTLQTAYTTGKENIKADGNAYYDNDAFFDCFIVQKNTHSNNTATMSANSNTPTPSSSNNKNNNKTTTITASVNNVKTGDSLSNNSFIFIVTACILSFIILIAGSLFIIIRRRKKS